MSKPDIVLCTPVRTPIGSYGGALKETPAPDLGAVVIRETLRRSGLAADVVDSVAMGHVIQAGTRSLAALDAARRPEARHRDPLHRRRPGYCPCAGNALTGA